MYTRTLAADGTLGPQTQVTTAAAVDSVPRAALSPDGALLTVHDGTAIKVLRLSPAGATVGTPVALPGATGRWPDIAGRPGEYLVVWEQPNVWLVPGAIRAQRLDAAGARSARPSTCPRAASWATSPSARRWPPGLTVGSWRGWRTARVLDARLRSHARAAAAVRRAGDGRPEVELAIHRT